MKMYYTYSIIFTILFIVGFIILIKRKDKKAGVKGAGIASFMTKLTIFQLISLIGTTWFGNMDMNVGVEIMLLGFPIGLMFFCDTDDLGEGISAFFGGMLCGVVLLIALQILRLFHITNIALVVKVISTLLALFTITVIYRIRFSGWLQRGGSRVSSYRPSSSSSYNGSSSYTPSSSSSSSSGFDLFNGKDFEIRKNYLTGNNEYYRDGKKIATARENIWGEQEIYDNNGNKQLVKKQSLFGDEAIYEDKYGNTKYRQKGDFLTDGSYIEDDKYNKVASHDPWDDLFSFNDHYKGK